MIKVRTLLVATVLAQIAVTGVLAEPLACFVQYSDVRFTTVRHSVVLLPYNQCLTYTGREGSFIRGRADWRAATTEGWIYAGDVSCSPGSCRRSLRSQRLY